MCVGWGKIVMLTVHEKLYCHSKCSWAFWAFTVYNCSIDCHKLKWIYLLDVMIIIDFKNWLKIFSCQSLITYIRPFSLFPTFILDFFCTSKSWAHKSMIKAHSVVHTLINSKQRWKRFCNVLTGGGGVATTYCFYPLYQRGLESSTAQTEMLHCG